jgi:hypothetical protein
MLYVRVCAAIPIRDKGMDGRTLDGLPHEMTLYPPAIILSRHIVRVHLYSACGGTAQTSHNVDCVLGSLCYIRPCSI